MQNADELRRQDCLRLLLVTCDINTSNVRHLQTSLWKRAGVRVINKQQHRSRSQSQPNTSHSQSNPIQKNINIGHYLLKLFENFVGVRFFNNDVRPPHFLKSCADLLATPLFQKSFTDICLPDDWKSANVIPLFKFEISSFTRYEAMNGGAKCRNGVVCGG